MPIPTKQEALANAADAPDFFAGFTSSEIPVPGGTIFARIGGSGPPLLCLHGYPQTSAMWHAVAPRLARDFTVITADLRGYGRSFKPDPIPENYTKRAMAGDMRAAMVALGHTRFAILAHDRGARVAHRLAYDHPESVRAAVLLDIAPTREMYAHARSAFAQEYWHWYWLTQPAPFPERMIAADPAFFWLKKCGSGSAGLRPFVRQALDDYLTCFADPQTIAASCADYRAAATLDIEDDDAETGLTEVPLAVFWGAKGAIERHFDCLALWRQRARLVEGQALPGGHYLAEELPESVLDVALPFLRHHAGQ